MEHVGAPIIPAEGARMSAVCGSQEVQLRGMMDWFDPP
jgi:hypothetical protein